MANQNIREINVRFVSNEGAGEQKNLNVTENMTVEQFIAANLSGPNPEDLPRPGDAQLAVTYNPFHDGGRRWL